MLCFQVYKLSKFWSKYQMQQKIFNRIFKTLSHQRTNDPIIYYVWENILIGFPWMSSWIYSIDTLRVYARSPDGWISLQSSSPREKEKKWDNSHKACMGTLSCGRSSPIYRYLVCRFFIKKSLIIMYISNNMDRPYVCDPLGPYISLFKKFIDQITSYCTTLLNYLNQHLD